MLKHSETYIMSPWDHGHYGQLVAYADHVVQD